jgi:hypothetical protein
VIAPGPGRPVDWHAEITQLLEWHWDNLLRPRLDGLTDAEYLWEPAPGCWSVRPRAEASSAHAAGSGDVVIDWALPAPEPPPLTTIAWRMGHLALALGERDSRHFGDGSVSYTNAEWSLTAAGGLALLDHWYAAWAGHLRELTADDLGRSCGPSEGPYADAPFGALLLHIAREVIHHGAEICLLRDLHRATGGTAPS